MKKVLIFVLCLNLVFLVGCGNAKDNSSRKEIEVLLPNGETAKGELPEIIDENSVTIAKPKPVTTAYVGSKSTKKFHLADCTWAQKIDEDNKVYFSHYNDFIKNGYKPCKSCNP